PLGVEHAVIFEPILPGHRLPSGASRFEPPRRSLPEYDGNPASLAFATVADLSALIHAGKVTSLELTRMYLDRLKRHGPELHCVITLTAELALKQAERADAELKAGRSRGPLHGIPYGAKDLLATKRIPTTYGVEPLKDQVLDFDATVIHRLVEAGAVLLCKSCFGELVLGDVWLGVTMRIAWDPEKGSSGSSAVFCIVMGAGLFAFD